MSNTMTPVATGRLGPNRGAARAAAIGFLGLVVFQAALALGAPLGTAAWGGAEAQIPTSLRIASGVAAVLWGMAALVILGRGGFDVPLLSPGFVRRGIWVLVALLPLGAVMNFASPSPWERFIWGPVALILAVLTLVVARGEYRTASEASARAAS